MPIGRVIDTTNPSTVPSEILDSDEHAVGSRRVRGQKHAVTARFTRNVGRPVEAEPIDDVDRLLVRDRAHAVYDPPAGRSKFQCVLQERTLELSVAAWRILQNAEADLWAAPHRAESGAGRIEKDPVE